MINDASVFVLGLVRPLLVLLEELHLYHRLLAPWFMVP